MNYSNIFVCLMGMGTVFFGLICLIALTTLMVLVMVFGMLIMNFIQRRIAAKEAREIAESEKRISAMSEHG